MAAPVAYICALQSLDILALSYLSYLHSNNTHDSDWILLILVILYLITADHFLE